MKTLAGCIVLLFFTAQIHAQLNGPAGSSYSQAVGVKFPGGISLTYKKFVADTRSVEALLTSWNKGFRLAGLYEFNFYSFNTVEGLAWFVGPGAHIGFWKSQYGKDYNSYADLGIDGIIGIDYKFKNIPINASLDWEPAITLVGTAGVTPAFGGFAVRYTF